MRIIGAADGVIIPIIITAHMAKMRNACDGVQGENPGTIMLMPRISIAGAFMRCASVTMQAHASPAITRSAAPTTSWSRRRTAASAVSERAVNE